MMMKLFGDEACRNWLKTDRRERYSDSDVPRLFESNEAVSDLVANMLTWDRDSRLDSSTAANQAQECLFADSSQNVTENMLRNDIERLRTIGNKSMHISMRMMHIQFLLTR